MNKTEIQDKYNSIVNSIIELYQSRDNLELIAGIELVELENMFNNFRTKSFIESDGVSFKNFLMDRLGRSYKQVYRTLIIGRWIKEKKINSDDLLYIPMTKIEIVAKSNNKLTDDILRDLRELSYKEIKRMYG